MTSTCVSVPLPQVSADGETWYAPVSIETDVPDSQVFATYDTGAIDLSTVAYYRILPGGMVFSFMSGGLPASDSGSL